MALSNSDSALSICTADARVEITMDDLQNTIQKLVKERKQKDFQVTLKSFRNKYN